MTSGDNCNLFQKLLECYLYRYQDSDVIDFENDEIDSDTEEYDINLVHDSEGDSGP